eukprot:5092522-Amphidinium_carterae.1
MSTWEEKCRDILLAARQKEKRVLFNTCVTGELHARSRDPNLLRCVRFKAVLLQHRLLRLRHVQPATSVWCRIACLDDTAMYELWYPKWEAEASTSGLKRCK